MAVNWYGMNGTVTVGQGPKPRIASHSSGSFAVFAQHEAGTFSVRTVSFVSNSVTVSAATNLRTGLLNLQYTDAKAFQLVRLAAEGAAGDVYLATYPTRTAYASGPPLIELCVFRVTPTGAASVETSLTIEGRRRESAYNNWSCVLGGDGTKHGVLMARATSTVAGGGCVQTVRWSGGLILGAEQAIPLEREQDAETFHRRYLIGVYVGSGYSVVSMIGEATYTWNDAYATFEPMYGGGNPELQIPMMVATTTGAVQGPVTLQSPDSAYTWPEDARPVAAAHPAVPNRIYIALSKPHSLTPGEVYDWLAEVDLTSSTATVQRFVDYGWNKGGVAYPVDVSPRNGVIALRSSYTSNATQMGVVADAFAAVPQSDYAAQYQFYASGYGTLSTSATRHLEDGIALGQDGYYTLVTAGGRAWLGFAYIPPPPSKDITVTAVAPAAQALLDVERAGPLRGRLLGVRRAFIG